MRPEYYADLYRRYSTYCRNYDGNRLFKIASGASDYDYNWTEVLMKNVGHRMDGLSLHYYTVLGWSGSKGSATKFNDEDYYWTMGKCRETGYYQRSSLPAEYLARCLCGFFESGYLP